MRIRLCLTAAVITTAILAPSSVRAQARLDAPRAAAVFAEARRVADADAGRLWGTPIDGPVLLVRPDDRRTYASRTAHGFRAEGAVFVGTLPDSVLVANTSVTFDDTTWTMIVWPLPDDTTARRALIAHELWHRVQDGIGFPARDGATEYLGLRDARYWLRLEWRALAVALRSGPDERLAAVADALLFREARLRSHPDAEVAERHLLMHEGLAEYTGWTLAGPTPEEARRRAALRLDRAEDLDTFVRSFAYYSGPAWGLLLDALDPGWTRRATKEVGLPSVVARTIGWSVPDRPEVAARERADRYDGQALAREEDRLETERAARRDRQRARYVTGPVLRLDFGRMSVSFDPGTVDVLEGVGRVYASMTVTDAWGTLEVGGGGLILSDFSGAVVPAPSDPSSRPVVGDGYVLHLSEGWTLVPGERAGDLSVDRVGR